MDHRENILKIVKEKGPLLPSQINRELRTNVLFASAMLSEMVDQKKIRLTSMRIGGSPLYYCDGQESKLEDFAHKLGGREYRVFELLKKSRILRDRDQDPQTRVALREIKDFAIPLEVSANGSTDLFWKFYLLPDDEAESSIRDYINSKVKTAGGKEGSGPVAGGGKQGGEASVVQQPARQPAKQPSAQGSQQGSKQPAVQSSQERQVQPEQAQVAQDMPAVAKPKEVQATIGEMQTSVRTPGPVSSLDAAPSKPVTSVKMTKLEEDEVPEFSYQPAVSFSTAIDTDEEVKLEKRPEPEPEPEGPVFPEDDEFFDRVKAFFDSSGIDIVDFASVRKGTELDFIITLPSNVGVLNYYCKAKSKAKVTDGDISTAFVHGQMKKLPILFITLGDLTKSAQELLDKEFRSMFVKRI